MKSTWDVILMFGQRGEDAARLTVLYSQHQTQVLLSVADPGIDRRGGGGTPINEIISTHVSWHSYALEGPRGMLPRTILKSEASEAF